MSDGDIDASVVTHERPGHCADLHGLLQARRFRISYPALACDWAETMSRSRATDAGPVDVAGQGLAVGLAR